MQTEKKDFISRKKISGSVTIVVLIVLAVFLFFTASLVYWMIQNKDNPGPVNQPEFVISTSKSAGAALLILADKKGFFSEEGANITVKYFNTAGEGFKDMLAGTIQMSAVAETPLVRESFNRTDFRILSTIGTFHNDTKIIVRNNVSNLKGKRVGCTKIGQSAHFFLYLYLLQQNLTLDDILIVYHDPETLLALIKKGELDAVALFEPHIMRAMPSLGPEYTILSEPGLYNKTFNIVAKASFLSANRDLVMKFLRALYRAEKFIFKDKAAAYRIIGNELGITVEQVESIYNSSSSNLILSEELILTLYDQAQWMKKYALTPNKMIPEYSDLIDSTFLQEVLPNRVMLHGVD